MIEYSEWLPEIRSSVSGVDDPVINQQISATMRKFFVKGTWREELFPITLAEGDSSYSFGRLAGYYALALDSAKIDDERINVLSEAPRPGVQFDRGVYVDAVRDRIVVLPEPNAAMAGSILTVVAFLKPLPDCTVVPERIFQEFFDVILDGIKHNLYVMPSKPWSNRNLALYHGRLFSAGIARARELMRKGYSSSDPVWRYPFWA